MQTIRLRVFTASIALVTVLSPSLNFIRAQNTAIDTYAITNARIMTAAGPAIERGTVVIRNGLIAAVGTDVRVPADARMIDGAGLTVYPGLIDSYTSLAIPEPSPAPSPSPGFGGGFFAQQRPAGSPTGVPNSSQAVGLQPELMADELIRAGAADVEAARNAGITTALTAPRSGIWMGQSALIELAGETPQQMIVRSPVAMNVGFTPLRGTYPGSLLGVFAALRQMLLDAQRYRDSMQIYDRSPRGIRRPTTDKSLAALIPVLEGQMPVVMYADREREIERALDLAAEFKLKPIIAGGLESWKVADRLRQANVPVLLSLNLPRRTTAALPEADPEPMRVLRERVEAQKTAAKLAAAKVRFALQSGHMTDITEFLANAGKEIENGLTRDDALRALTLWPAEIFGVSNQLGSIETGKIANLTVMRGDLFDRNSRVAHLFIDGKPVDLRPATPSTGRASASGTWTLNIDLGKDNMAASLTLQQEGERLRGSIQGSLGSAEIANASLSANGEVRFTVKVTVEGQTSEATFTGTVTGNDMRGSVAIAGGASGSFTGTRGPANP
jgi:imidazolonepropionase-like amidohydrolase